ncbi:PREDICTED: uncharacterized protein LOC107331429 isoform X2 [Acropora digitifera]|uniref:uncharacterized protein LOC107331429 isoform X2 n=1 Tax=Acropora digitifera TaxID=70779 RepID=UPI000779FA1D|nr:PREDICTED: uncharacterized protein LOC107331429 isoform X2 [Acropora digitifera]
MDWLRSAWCGKTQKNNFEVLIYEKDFRELCAYVLMKPEIETGGDLFGLWHDEHRAVIQVALGPGKECMRTTASFYQDVNYLANVGTYLTEKEGLCHIGEWHSHHQLGLAKPSSGDKATVWNNMPTYQLSRFVLFIANIEASDETFKVNFRCFLFEIDNNGYQLPVLPGEVKILHSQNPFSQKNEVRLERINGAEIQLQRRYETNVDINDLELGEENPGTPFVIMQKRYFEVLIYEEDYKEMCAHVLRKPNIETGGDLFGLWQDERKAVVQLALGPGKGCRRTSTSFYQDVEYLAKVGSYLTEKEGVCHIGEWHSHHQLGLARPSGGDEGTVWRNMPTYQLSRFVIFIANIEATGQSYKVNIGCFLFEIDGKGNQLPVKQGRFKIIASKNPFWLKKDIDWQRKNGAENSNGDLFEVSIKDLKLEKGDKSPSLTLQRSRSKRNNSSECHYYMPPCKKGNNVYYGSRASDSNQRPERNGRLQTQHQVKDVHKQRQNREENYAPDHDNGEMEEDETENASKRFGSGEKEKNERGGMVKSEIISGGTKQCDKQGESSDPPKLIQTNDLGKAKIPDEGHRKGPSLLQDKGKEEGRIRDKEQEDVKETDKGEMQEDETANASGSFGGGKQEENDRGGMVKSDVISGGTKQCDKQGESSDPSKVIQTNDFGKAKIPDEGHRKGPSLLQDKGKVEGRVTDEEQQDVKETDQNKDGVKDENKEGPVEEGSKMISQPQANQQHEMVPEDQIKIGNDEDDSAKEDKMRTAEGQDEGENIKDQDHSTKGSSQDQSKDMKGDSKKVKENKATGKKPVTQEKPRAVGSKEKPSKDEKKKSKEKDEVERETSKGKDDKAKAATVLNKTGTGTTSGKKNEAAQPKSTSKKTAAPSKPKGSTKKKH